MYAGRIVESGPRERMFSAPRHPYTPRLPRAVPDIAATRTVVGIPGHAALPPSSPEARSFHPRCEFAQDDCSKAFPPVTDLGAAHQVRCYHIDQVAKEAPPEGAGQADAHTIGDNVVLAVQSLDAHYGARHTLFDIDLEVHHNEC